MFSGFMQTAAYKNLDGVNGLSGWRLVSLVLEENNAARKADSQEAFLKLDGSLSSMLLSLSLSLCLVSYSYLGSPRTRKPTFG